MFEFPIDITILYFLIPLTTKFFAPGEAFKKIWTGFIKIVSSSLCIDGFLFLNPQLADTDSPAPLDKDSKIYADNVFSRPDPTYLRVPAIDNIPLNFRTQKLFTPVDKKNARLDGKVDSEKLDSNFTVIYVPSYFGWRLCLFVLYCWAFSIFLGCTCFFAPCKIPTKV